MRLCTIILIKSVLCLLFGIIFVLAPGALLALYGAKVEPSGAFVAQLYGAAFILLGVMLWFARTDQGSEALRAIVLAVLIGDGIGFIVHVYREPILCRAPRRQYTRHMLDA